MLTPKKKLSRKEIKEDTLITTYVRATSFYEENKKNISIGVVAFVLLVAAGYVYLTNRSENNTKAMTQLGAVYEIFDAGQYQIAIDGIPEKNVPGLKAIVDNYGGTQAGDLARFYLANAYYQTGKYDEALKNFEDSSPKEELLVVSRLSGIAECYEAQGKYREAADNFEKAATKYSTDASAAENLSHAARNYGLAGDKEHAIELYKRVKKNYPTSASAREADRFISQLSV